MIVILCIIGELGFNEAVFCLMLMQALRYNQVRYIVLDN